MTFLALPPLSSARTLSVLLGLPPPRAIGTPIAVTAAITPAPTVALNRRLPWNMRSPMESFATPASRTRRPRM